MDVQNLMVGNAFLIAIKAALAKHTTADLAVSAELKRVHARLSALPPLSGRISRSGHAITGHIATVLRREAESTRPLIGAIAPLLHFLPWKRTEGDTAASPYLARRAAVADVVGPGAPLRSDELCIGLALIAPNTLCPSHHHPDLELCHTVTGRATWVISGVSRTHSPGAFISTPAQSVHAIHTDDEPILAVYMRILDNRADALTLPKETHAGGAEPETMRG